MSSLHLHRGTRRFFSALLLIVASHCAVAQTGTEAAISKVEVQLVTAPAISFSYSGRSLSSPVSPSKKWMEIETTFAWQPLSGTDLYSDDLTVDYYVLLNNPSIKYPQGAMLTGKTALSGVPAKSLDQKNGELKTVIYVSSRSLERLFGGKVPSDANSAVKDIGVTISKQGQVIAQKSLHGTVGWWPQFQQTPGFLLNKPETPFSDLNWDYYEAVKKQP
jgi:hypothetical protein